MTPEVAEALAWMESSKRGYKAAAKRFGLTVEALRTAKATTEPRAPARPPARETTDPELPAGVDLITWYRAELRSLDAAWLKASPRDMGVLTKARAQVVERLRVLEAEAASNHDLASPESLLEAVLAELEKSVHLLDARQAKRLVQTAETVGRMHDWTVTASYAAASSAPSSTPTTK